MTLKVEGLATEEVRRLRNGGLDANGQAPLVRRTKGLANPCRHCLQLIEEGTDMLVLAYRPFETLQPYAEVGPIFLHAGYCPRYEKGQLPDWFTFLDPATVRGYDCNDWILYETGEVVSASKIEEQCMQILSRSDVAYVHIRSKYGCFQCEVRTSLSPTPLGTEE